ncbi:MAG: acyltransferase [Lachnospiraceae bacterium]|nr:acyltransferase [Lachnospiraceae bacterium]
MQKDTQKERIIWLDIVRAFSVILIICGHFNDAITGKNISIANKAYLIPSTFANGSFGTLGVSLFFMISGASLMYTYSNNIKIKTYFTKRFKGIYPMFWLAYAGAFLYYFWKNKGIHFIAEKWTFVLTILGFDGYFNYRVKTFYLLGEWFLGCIIFMYILFPLIRLLYKKNGYLFLGCYLVIYTILVLYYPFQMSITRNLFIRLMDFCFGIMVIDKIKKIKFYYAVPTSILLLLLLLYKVPGHGMYAITLMGMSAFIMLIAVSEKIKNKHIIQLCQTIGKYSYAIFLVHHIVINEMLARFSGCRLSFVEGSLLLLEIVIVIVFIAWSLFSVEKRTVAKVKGV